jgi:hypothetical protein
MKVPTIPVAQAVLKVLVDYDVQDVVISPGSRNAPLTLGLTSNTFFKTNSIVDGATTTIACCFIMYFRISSSKLLSCSSRSFLQ